jgi:hypothetical protein
MGGVGTSGLTAGPPEGPVACRGRTAAERTLTSVAWRPRDDLAFSEWVELGRRLGLAGRSVGWWIGDWLAYGNRAYGERYVRAARITGYDVQTLMNMVYVASRFEISRRRENLSWSHHAELASMTGDEQEHWLARAEAERLSVRCLRQEIRRARRCGRGHGGAQLRAATGARSSPRTAGADAEHVHVVCPECGHAFVAPPAPGALPPPPR